MATTNVDAETTALFGFVVVVGGGGGFASNDMKEADGLLALREDAAVLPVGVTRALAHCEAQRTIHIDTILLVVMI